ncbi:MAG: hypothetical protein ABW185_22500 [Sedimenticola sp.]
MVDKRIQKQNRTVRRLTSKIARLEYALRPATDHIIIRLTSLQSGFLFVQLTVLLAVAYQQLVGHETRQTARRSRLPGDTNLPLEVFGP